MRKLDEYGMKYPDLVWDIWLFFADSSTKGIYSKTLEQRGWSQEIAPKCALDFCNKFKDKYREINNRDKDLMIQPRTVSIICEKLCENDLMSKMIVGSFNNPDGVNNFYKTWIIKPLDEIISSKESISRHINNLVYGFSYIYESNKENVRPVWVKKNNRLQNGTCFNSVVGIVTAKHCIDNCAEIQIDGVKADVLKSAKILGLTDIDLVLIQPKSEYNWGNKFLVNDGAILDEIMVMGYPNHCGFDRFLTATTGAIAAIEYSYLTKYKLMLLTGKIKGGNSGGPVLNKDGEVVGIVTESPAPEGDYDKFGYGMAISSSYLDQLSEMENNYNFVDEISPEKG